MRSLDASDAAHAPSWAGRRSADAAAHASSAVVDRATWRPARAFAARAPSMLSMTKSPQCCMRLMCVGPGSSARRAFQVASGATILSHKRYLTIRNDVAAIQAGWLAVICLIAEGCACAFRQGSPCVSRKLQGDGVIVTRIGVG
jgi:hypothetical protein